MKNKPLSLRYPSLDIDTLRASYDMLGRWEDETLSPLAGLVVVQQQLTAPYSLRTVTAYNEIVYDLLSGLLIEQFSQLRNQYGLAYISPTRFRQQPANRTEAVEDLQVCGIQSNRYLTGYAALYYRYIRPELELSVEEISQYLNQIERNVRRYEKKCFGVILSELNRIEIEARSNQRRLRYSMALPQEELFDIETQSIAANTIMAGILDPHPILQWYIFGPPGIGKTSLALRICQRLADQSAIDDVVWLDLRLNSANYDSLYAEALVNLVIERLDLHPTIEATSSAQLISRYLAYLAYDNHRLLLVLDNADGWQTIIEANWMWLQQCILIVTARIPDERWQKGELKCPEFTQQESFAFLQNLARTYPSRREPNYSAIIQRVGGNPAFLKRIFRFIELFSSEMAPEEIVYIDHFRFHWEHLPDFSKEVFWWIACLSLDEYVSISILLSVEVYFVSQQSITFNQSLEYLIESGLVEHNTFENRRAYRVVEDNYQVIARIPSGSTQLHQVIVRFLADSAEVINGEQRSRVAAAFLTLLHTLDKIWKDVMLSIAKLAQPHLTQNRQWQQWLGHLEWINKSLPTLAYEKIWVGLERVLSLRHLGSFAEAEYILTHVYYTAQQYEDPPALCDALMEQSILLFYQDKDQAAFEKAQQVYNLLQLGSDMDRLERSMFLMAQALSRTNAVSARKWVQTITRRDAEVWDLIARIELNLDPRTALVAAEKALAMLEPDNPAYPRSLGLLARTLAANGRLAEAIEKFHLAINLLQHQHDPVGLARMHNNLGVAYSESNEAEYIRLAQNEFERSLQLARTIQDRHSEATAIQNLQYLENRRTDRRRYL